MYPPAYPGIVGADQQGSTSKAAVNGDAEEAAYLGAFEQLFGADAASKARVISHPLFEQLLAAHVACLRVGTPSEEQHRIDAALCNRDRVAGKYLALLSHMQSVSDPAENQELSRIMVNYIELLQTFKEHLLHHLQKEALEAISSCYEIEESLFNLTGVRSKTTSHNIISMSMQQECEKQECDTKDTIHETFDCLGINVFFQGDVKKALRSYVQRELKQDLNKDYRSKLKEVREEILQKRRTGKGDD